MQPLLASPPDPKHPLRFPLLASHKLDGIRCLIVDGEPVTRTLKPIPNRHIRNLLTGLPPLDGELIFGEPNAPGVYNMTNSAVMSIQGEPEITYYVFDRIDKPLLGFTDRIALVKDLPSFCTVLPQHQVDDQAQLGAFYEAALEAGYEGAMLRNPDALYKQGRSTAKEQTLLKVKPFSDYDAVVLSVYEAQHNTNAAVRNALGRTERSTSKAGLVGKGMLGGFKVRDIATNREFDVAPGMMTHEERDYWWRNRSFLTGRIIKYRCMDYGSKDAPRFTRWIGWRDVSDTLGV